MKKFILGLIIGAITFGTVGVYAALKYQASQVSYTPSDKTWKVSNVEDAINDLYNNSGSSGINFDGGTFKASQLPTLEKPGYKFLGWYTDKAKTNLVSADAVVDSNTKLYPGFAKDCSTNIKITDAYKVDSVNSGNLTNLNTYLFDGNTSKQGTYGALLLNGSSYVKFTVYNDIYIGFSSNSYNDSAGSSGKNALFYKLDDNGNETLYYTLTQLNNTKEYGKYKFTKGDYIVKPSARYVEFDEWHGYCME